MEYRRLSETGGRPEVTVLAADDQDSFLSAVRDLIQVTPGFRLTAEARSGEEAIALVASAGPDLVLMDVRMPGMGGIEATRSIMSGEATPVVVLVSVDDVNALPRRARSCGAAAILSKLDLRPDTLRAVWLAHRSA